MKNIVLRPLESAPSAEMAALQSAAFADFVQSHQLAEVIASESAARAQVESSQVQSPFGLAAFRGEVLVGWSQGYREGTNQFYMLNSGVAIAERRRGVYSLLVKALLAHAESQGYSNVKSRHTATNTAVIIAKLKLGFQVSGFEYSEVYGPLVQLTYLVGQDRRKLYETRASPIRPAQ
jgi:ribosomal protein S18 acetylase RimI-like enzyme